MRKHLLNVLDKPLAFFEQFIGRVRTKLKQYNDAGAKVAVNGYQSLLQPINANGWENVYLDQPIVPVVKMEDEIAFKVKELTSDGDVLLEAGCGFGRISAQLALENREIHLADFSTKILKQAERLFQASGLPVAGAHHFDFTNTFPLKDNFVDTVWSSGVLEHWTDEEVLPIIKEMVRVSRKSVISLVPYNGCLLYRMGKYLLEKKNKWPYGRELPRTSQHDLFSKAGLINISESIMLEKWAPNLLWDLMPKEYVPIKEWWNSLPDDDIVKQNQGYLLVTIGYKS